MNLDESEMSYSKSRDSTLEDYQKLVPKFLKLLASYGYSQAKLRAPLKVKKGDTLTTLSELSVKEALDKIAKGKFYSGKIRIHHNKKSISLSRSQISHDLTLEMNFQPDPKLKADIDNLFPKKKKKLSPGKEAEASYKASRKEMKKEKRRIEKRKKQ